MISKKTFVKIKTKILLVLLLLFFVWIVIIQSFKYKYPKKDEIDKRLNYLQRVIDQPLDIGSDIFQLSYENPEFMLFTYSYSVYALTNLTIKDLSYKERSEIYIKEAIRKVLNEKIYSFYGISQDLRQINDIHDYSVLYLGHLNLMLGCYRLISQDTVFNKLNKDISESLYQRYNETKFLNLESYSGHIWIPDNTVAIASLKLYSKNEKNDYDIICKKWLEYAKLNYIDKKTGLLYSKVNSINGKPIEEPRGSMLGWSIMFIYQFDSDFAIDLYNNYKKKFSYDLFVFRLFKEKYRSWSINGGDIDSGPILLGFSIPANEFALANSILAKDYKTARKLERLINLGAHKIETNEEIRYKLRFFNMNVSPMAEALILYSLTITKWVEK